MQKSTVESFAPDLLQSFLIDRTHIGGRLVRLGTVAETILHQNDYAPAVNRLLAEMLVIGTMLSYSLKTEGVLTLQASGDGPVPFIVVDVTHDGNLRGYAEVPEESEATLAALGDAHEAAPLSELLGKGRLAIILDTGGEGGRYEGIVALDAPTLSEALQHYFTQSQQADMTLKLASARGKRGWNAAGILVERMPPEGGVDAEPKTREEDEEDWRRVSLFMSTVKNEELLDMNLSSWKLLTRLFGEDGVWAYAPRVLAAKCRCSRARILDVLATISMEELEEMMDDGVVSVHCRFCNTTEYFDEATLQRIHPQ